MSAVISEVKRIIQVGRDPIRSPVQTPTESKITTRYGSDMVDRGLIYSQAQKENAQ